MKSRFQPVRINESDWRMLVILDSCRYDALNQFLGGVELVISPAYDTLGWLEEVFQAYQPIIYLTASPTVSLYCKGKKVFKRVVEVWKFGWNNKLNTVHPKTVRVIAESYLKKYESERFIVHFMQPHLPYIGEVRLPYKSGSPLTYRRVEADLKAGKLSLIRLVNAYLSNLNLALNEALHLARKVKGEIVITSDHGEMLGEDGMFGHVPPVCEKLLEVPWVVIKDDYEKK